MSLTMREEHSLLQPPLRRTVLMFFKVLRLLPVALSMKLHMSFYFIESIVFERCVTSRRQMLSLWLWLFLWCGARRQDGLPIAEVKAPRVSNNANKASSIARLDLSSVIGVKSVMNFRAPLKKEYGVSFLGARMMGNLDDMIFSALWLIIVDRHNSAIYGLKSYFSKAPIF